MMKLVHAILSLLLTATAIAEAVTPKASKRQDCGYWCPKTDTNGDLLVFYTPLPPFQPGEEFICYFPNEDCIYNPALLDTDEPGCPPSAVEQCSSL